MIEWKFHPPHAKTFPEMVPNTCRSPTKPCFWIFLGGVEYWGKESINRWPSIIHFTFRYPMKPGASHEFRASAAPGGCMGGRGAGEAPGADELDRGGSCFAGDNGNKFGIKSTCLRCVADANDVCRWLFLFRMCNPLSLILNPPPPTSGSFYY